jgi:Ni/Co efflux regulator RcnB
MRFKTLVLIPAIAVLANLFVSLPIAQSQTSANEAPQKVKLVVRTIDKDKTRANAASRSAKRYAFGTQQYNKQFAAHYMKDKYGWEKKQHSCLVKLWNRESGWRQNAHNKSSGAHGIPQSLPGKKMASMGSDWKTNPETQIKWGLKYIKGRYKTPCNALGHSNKHNWY